MKPSQNLSKNLCIFPGGACVFVDSFDRTLLKGVCADQGMVLNITWHQKLWWFCLVKFKIISKGERGFST